MVQETQRHFRKLPWMLANMVRVVSSNKPMIAPPETPMGRTIATAFNVPIRTRHLARYRAVCGIPDAPTLPHAYAHVLAMPLHMFVFASPSFPVKVLGLIHLRNTIRVYQAIPNEAKLSLHVECDTMRETPSGQEYDLITRAHRGESLVWEEVSTMLAHRATPGQRPTIERAGAAEVKTKLDVPNNTGRRYARVSGDINPIHLSARTAGWYGFKQAVAHGMWSMSRSLGEAAPFLPAAPLQIDTQFKLPLYLPSETIFRCQRNGPQVELSLSSTKDRLHLATQVKPL